MVECSESTYIECLSRACESSYQGVVCLSQGPASSKETPQAFGHSGTRAYTALTQACDGPRWTFHDPAAPTTRPNRSLARLQVVLARIKKYPCSYIL